MSEVDLSKACKQRFKGIENFLRRVAFNLGNTPSQTEVKIISCIPIDVTDLQQKIITLEKQLDNANKCGSQSRPTTSAIHTALCGPAYPTYSRQEFSNECKPEDFQVTPIEYHEQCLEQDITKQKKSAVSFIFPALYQDKNKPCNSLVNSRSSDIMDEKCKYKNLFRRDKKRKRRDQNQRVKTHLVYYAQTKATNSPFQNYDMTIGSTSKDVLGKNGDQMSRSYLADMIRKQYKTKLLAERLSGGSEISSPLCRDVEPPPAYDTDVCSCCHGKFHNIDHQMNKHPHVVDQNDATYTLAECINSGSIYYDSSYYDIVPVKEKPIKKKETESTTRKEPKNKMDIKCWPEDIRTKLQFQPYICNYQSVSPTRNSYCVRSFGVTLPREKENLNTRITPKREMLNKINKQAPVDSSGSCCIDCGDVYAKKNHGKFKKEKLTQCIPPTIICKNAECLTISVNNTDCQTETTQNTQETPQLLERIDKPPEEKKIDCEENKTESTLNQIKSILQSVLTEVKTNSQMKNGLEEKPKKDAVVQKGASQNTLQACSTLLNSFTYSPYNMDPYLASCSKQMASGNFYPPGMQFPPVKCMHNFPIFIQTPGRHVCASCYRHSSQIGKPPSKLATTTATNTEVDVNENCGSKETEKLIKEIYKSMALNVDIPTKETSRSEYEELKSSTNNSTNRYSRSKIEDIRVARGDIATDSTARRANKIDTTSVPFTTRSTFHSKVVSSVLNPPSNVMNTTDSDELRNERLQIYMKDENNERPIQRLKDSVLLGGQQTSATITASDEDTDDSSSESESEATVVPTEPVKKKAGFLNKMIRSVKLLKRKYNKKKAEQESDNEIQDQSDQSDSDDYQTIYSQKVKEKPAESRPQHPRRKSRTFTKIADQKRIPQSIRQDRFRRPYMEQEYRRHWNENLTFHDDQAYRYSSERPFSKESPRYGRPKYWQNYETRSVLVDQNTPYRQAPKAFTEQGTFINQRHVPVTQGKRDEMKATSKFAWLKKHKLGIHCGEQWKKFLLEG